MLSQSCMTLGPLLRTGWAGPRIGVDAPGVVRLAARLRWKDRDRPDLVAASQRMTSFKTMEKADAKSR
jgi:hypothetical protein